MNNLKHCSDAYQVSVRPAFLFPKLSVAVAALFSFTLFSCAPNSEEKAYAENSKEIASSVKSFVGEIATDTINGIPHNFIREANLKCKVKDVLQSTKDVERIVAQAGGFTTLSELNSNKDYSSRIQTLKDSVLELTYYTLTSNITIRVPNKKLDSVLLAMTDMALFIDSRTVKADDVKLKIFAHELNHERNQEFANRVAKKANARGAKLNHVISAEDKVLEKESIADASLLQSFDLADQVNYSTVTLSLYQSQQAMSALVALPPTVEPYSPSFAGRLAQSFMNGFGIIKGFIIFIVNFWGLFLILFLLFIITRKIVLHYTKKQITIPSRGM
jgi:hypothetical protein